MVDPLFGLFPSLETYFLWMFPQRKQQHRDLNCFLDMIDVIIEEKRRKVESGENQNENLQENEKDLLTLMLESESKGEGKMENAELQVYIHQNIVLLDSFIILTLSCVADTRVIFVYSFWQAMTLLQMLYPLLFIIWR
jgi:hypothetical protein